jgi:hypothetical protein
VSATNRSDRGGEGRDFFPTPAWCVHRWLDAAAELRPLAGHWLEPAPGDGAIVRAVNGWCSSHGKPSPKWTTCDIAAETGADLIADFAAFDCPELRAIAPPSGRFDLVVTNPPYNLALDFVKAGLVWAPIVSMLLRLPFLATQDRAAWMRANTPRADVLPDRPQFDLEKDGTDQTEYAWLSWGLGPAVVNILRTTPLDVRKGERRKLRTLPPPDPRQEGLFSCD